MDSDPLGIFDDAPPGAVATLTPADAHLPRSPEFMAALARLNVRQQRFVAEVLRGRAGAEAYALAYPACLSQHARSVNGSKLMRDERVAACLAAARTELARITEYGVGEAMEELDDTISFAKETKNATALARAVELKMRLHALLIERVDQRQLGAFQINIEGLANG